MGGAKVMMKMYEVTLNRKENALYNLLSRNGAQCKLFWAAKIMLKASKGNQRCVQAL